MSDAVRTRFAASPTGELHIGGLRTALFQWAFVKANGGQFILRIEDTDQSRYAAGSVENIYAGLRWLGLDWDEGPGVGGPHGPYVQSERLDQYEAAASELIRRGRAYPCFCTPERLAQLRKDQQASGQPPGYDGRCRALPADEASERARSETSVVRFRMERSGTTTLTDLIRGAVSFENALQDDFVILKSDGFPTYHLAMLVDDHDMENQPRHSRGGVALECAQAPPALHRHGLARARVRAPAAAGRQGWPQALEASRRRCRARLPRSRLPAGGDAELPRVPRLVPRRQDVADHPGRIRTHLQPRSRRAQPRLLRCRAPRLAQRPPHSRADTGGLGRNGIGVARTRSAAGDSTPGQRGPRRGGRAVVA